MNRHDLNGNRLVVALVSLVIGASCGTGLVIWALSSSFQRQQHEFWVPDLVLLLLAVTLSGVANFFYNLFRNR